MRNIYQILFGFLGETATVAVGAPAPAGWTFTEPPAAEHGKAAKWAGSGWELVDYAEYLEAKVAADAKQLEDAKSAKLASACVECDRRVSGMTALLYPQTEVMTFTKQESEARAYLVDGTAETTLVDALAQARGIDKADLVARIIAKADAFALGTGLVIGHRQKLEDAIAAAVSIEDLDAIDVLSGWPA